MFIISWNELLIPLILNIRAEFMTLPVVIASLVGDVHVVLQSDDGDLPAGTGADGGTGSLLQKFVVQGLSAGAVKG